MKEDQTDSKEVQKQYDGIDFGKGLDNDDSGLENAQNISDQINDPELANDMNDLKGQNENTNEDDKEKNDENKVDVDKDNFTGEQTKLDKSKELNNEEEQDPEGN